LDSPTDALLYSVDAMSTRGASGLTLQRPWQMMGALEAVNGMLLFGVSTAYVFAVDAGVVGAHRAPTMSRYDDRCRKRAVQIALMLRRSSAAVATSREGTDPCFQAKDRLSARSMMLLLQRRNALMHAIRQACIRALRRRLCRSDHLLPPSPMVVCP